jgi:hypothetical protein
VDEEGNREFEFNVEQDESIRKLVRIRSIAHQDTITVTHFKTTNKLTIQGKPSLRDRSRVVPRSDRACVFTKRFLRSENAGFPTSRRVIA